jgi:hypothetical protein
LTGTFGNKGLKYYNEPDINRAAPEKESNGFGSAIKGVGEMDKWNIIMDEISDYLLLKGMRN